MNSAEKVFAGLVVAVETYYFGVIGLCFAVGCMIFVPAVLGRSSR